MIWRVAKAVAALLVVLTVFGVLHVRLYIGYDESVRCEPKEPRP